MTQLGVVRRARRRSRRGWTWLLVGVLLGALIWWQGLAVFRVSGGSMAPTFPEGSIVLVVRPGLDGLLGLRRTYRAGDIVVAEVPGGLSIKRAVAIGPATVSFESGRLSVDGAVVAAPYADRAGTTDLESTDVPAGSVYLVGDDRRPLASRDSRDFGPVPFARVKGRVVAGVRSRG